MAIKKGKGGDNKMKTVFNPIGVIFATGEEIQHIARIKIKRFLTNDELIKVIDAIHIRYTNWKLWEILIEEAIAEEIEIDLPRPRKHKKIRPKLEILPPIK